LAYLGAWFRCFIIILIISLLPFSAFAVAFKVKPLALNFEPADKTKLVTIVNTSGRAITVQVDSRLWFQDEVGNERYKDTKDIIFFPKIVKIAKGEEKIVRVGYRGKAAKSKEKAYRLYFEQLRDSRAADGAVSFSVRFGIPLFVKLSKPTHIFEIADSDVQGGELLVDIANKGNSHFVAKRITAKGIGSGNRSTFIKDIGGWYVLPGSTKRFSMQLAQDTCTDSSNIDIEVMIGTSVLQSNATVDEERCIAKDNKIN